eukprot:CAMPEP_0184729112 /NCGR_PEP_ID=MMETSP0314-20130426/43105_1 /TAXON_ID=38298 /ORGANISM="Rhodella maculata, Strain CCMP 736" /LENGTH=70 /DNA_ID=CAMNT_0027195105 /DNA_START=56 /DNA_END=265 /DNA_ORIENTATION=-
MSLCPLQKLNGTFQGSSTPSPPSSPSSASVACGTAAPRGRPRPPRSAPRGGAASAPEEEAARVVAGGGGR